MNVVEQRWPADTRLRRVVGMRDVHPLIGGRGLVVGSIAEGVQLFGLGGGGVLMRLVGTGRDRQAGRPRVNTIRRCSDVVPWICLNVQPVVVRCWAEARLVRWGWRHWVWECRICPGPVLALRQSPRRAGPWLGGAVPHSARSNEQMTVAAKAFLDSLSGEQRAKVQFAKFDDAVRTLERFSGGNVSTTRCPRRRPERRSTRACYSSCCVLRRVRKAI